MMVNTNVVIATAIMTGIRLGIGGDIGIAMIVNITGLRTGNGDAIGIGTETDAMAVTTTMAAIEAMAITEATAGTTTTIRLS